NSS
ncbi:hypothetical protein MK338_08005, partial [Streptococcus vestibularis]